MTSPTTDPRVSVRRRPASDGKSPSLLSALITSLEGHLIHVGVVGVVEGVLGVLAFSGFLSSLVGEGAIRAGAVIAAILGVLGMMILLALSRAEACERIELDRRLLRRYCAMLEERFNYRWSVKAWRHILDIDRKGNSLEKITFTLIAECDLLDFFSIWSGAGWGWPEKYRRKVKIDVHTLMAGDEGGTSPDFTWAWSDRGRLAITIHLSEPAPRGEEVSFTVTLAWPLKCAPLIKWRADDFARTFNAPSSSMAPLPYLYYAVILPAGYGARFNVIGLKRGKDRYTIADEVNSTGRLEIVLEAHGVPLDRRVGMRLQLR